MVEAKKPGLAKGRSLPPDPVFEVSATRPEKPVTLAATPDGRRPNRPLTDALLQTLHTGGSIVVAYDPESHKRLTGRFKTVESRQKNIDVKYSLVKDEKDVPIKVEWWAEEKPKKPAPPSSPTPPPHESVVGRDVE
jgi:hypothetical protein